MLFKTATSPFISTDNTVQLMMTKVLIALIPGTLAAIFFFGWGVLFNLIISAAVCLGSEALVLKIRNRPVTESLLDGSALVTACLLAIALPPLAPWWLTAIAALFAIVIAKHLYGGLGFNPFNPAMVGYIVVLISFPREMTLWTAPYGVTENILGITDTFHLIFGTNMAPAGEALDSITMATPIDTLKTQINLERDIESTRAHPIHGLLFGSLSGVGWEWINVLFFAGGFWLVKQKVADWRIPTAMLLSLLIFSNIMSVVDYATYSSSMFHLLSGGTMLCAFFIATDPVTASTTPLGRWIYGASIGALIYIIRTWGGYPDGIAFAVVLMNMTAPLIDYYTQPVTYGNKDHRG